MPFILSLDEGTTSARSALYDEQGRSVVWSGVREKAEAYAFTLQQWHLTTVLEPDEAR